MKQDSETKMDFDYSVTTEDRFALRKWLEGFLALQNRSEVGELKQYLSAQLYVEGFGSDTLDKKSFLEFLKSEKEKGNLSLIRYPKMKVVYKDAAFVCHSSFEGLSGSLLSYEGDIEFEIVKHSEGFIIDYIKFYPRLMMR